MKKYILFITIIFLSCKKNDPEFILFEKANDTININPTAVSSQQVNYSDIFDNVEYTLLPTADNFLIGEIDKLLITEKYMFIIDQYISKSVFCIDKNGNELFKLSKTGSGPGEYISLEDVVYNERKDELAIYCNVRKKILYFDLKGNFLKEESVPYNILRFQKLENDNLVFFCDYNVNKNVEDKGLSPNIILSSPNYSIVAADNYFNASLDKSLIWTSKEQFSEWNDTLSIKPNHSNIVYHITQDKIYPAYKLDFGKSSIDNRYWSKIRERDLSFNKFEDYCNDMGFCESFRFFENSDFLYFVYKRHDNIYYVFQSKLTGKQLHFKNFINDIDEITVFRPKTLHQNKMYCILESEIVFQNKDILKGKIPDNILSNVQEFGNPIIVAFSIKPL